MFTIFKTSSYKNGSRYIYKVLKNADPKNLSLRHIVLVPDRASLSAEQQMLDSLGGSFNVQVLTIRRFASQILPEFNYLSKQGGIMLLTKLLAQLKSELVCFTKGVDSGGFAESIYEVICQLKYSQIPPQKIVTENLPKTLRGKLSDVKLIYQAYQEALKDTYVDSAGKLELLIDGISLSERVKNSRFYIYDFDNVTSQEKAIISQLVRYSLGVTVACACSDKGKHRYLYLNEVYNSMLDIAKEQGITPNIVSESTFDTPVSKQIGENLYTYQRGKRNPQPTNEEHLMLVNMADAEAETYALACEIASRVQAGARYSDFYVVTSDIDTYRLSTNRIFADLDIPFFMDTQVNLSDHIFSQYVVDFLSMVKSGYKLDNALNVVKNCLFGCVEDTFLFENYCLKYNISYNYDTFTLGKEEDVSFETADRVREVLQRKILAYPFAMRESMLSYIEKVKDFIDKEQLQAKLVNFEAKQKQAEEVQYAKATAQVYEKFMSVLNQMRDIFGDDLREYSLEEFIRILSVGISGVNISVVPVYNDCVVVTNMAKSRKHDIKCLCLLGATQTSMPIVKRDTKLLSDKNLAEMAAVGLNLEPQMALENKRERFSLFQLLLEPTQLLYVSYPTSGASSKEEALIPGDFVMQLTRLFTEDGANYPIREIMKEGFYTEKNLIAVTAANKRMLKDNQPVKSKYYKVLSELYEGELSKYFFDKQNVGDISVGEKLFFSQNATSVTKLEDFYGCPYNHYFKYGLYIQPRKVAELAPSDLGNILHAVLELYVAKASTAETKAETRKKAMQYFAQVMQEDYYRGVAKDVRFKKIIAELKEECVTMCQIVKEQLADSKFVNYATELRFGGKTDNMKAIEIECGSQTIRLKGIIDRVDVCEGEFIIIDYKSGHPEFSEKSLYMGRKLQLLVYLSAIIDNLNLKPVGYYYMKLHNDFVREENTAKAYTYVGRSLDNQDCLNKIDTNLANGSSKRLGLKLNKDGSVRKTTALLTEKQLNAEIAYAIDIIRRAGLLMQRGFIAASPVKGICEYCDYAEICGFGDVFGKTKRDITDVTAETIEEVMSCD